MSVGFSNSWRGAGTVVFLWGVVTFGTLQAADESRPRGRAIEISDLNGGTAPTNTITLGSPSVRRPDALERVSNPRSLDFRTSRRAPLPPPSYGTASSNRRNNQSDDWASPEDSMNNYVMEKILGIPNYAYENAQTAASSFRGNRGLLSRNRGQTNSPALRGFSFASPEGTAGDRQDVESERDSGRGITSDGAAFSMKTLFNTGPGGFGSPARQPGSFADLLDSNRRVEISADDLSDRKSREDQLDAFRKNLIFQPAAPAESFNPFAVTPAPGAAPVGGQVNPGPQSPFSVLPGTVNPTLIPGVPGVPTAPTVPSVPGLPGYSPPDLSAPHKLSRPEPVVVNPRRPF